MSQAINPPISNYNLAPVAVDRVINTIQVSLMSLPWLRNSLGRVRPQLVDGKIQPWIFKDPRHGDHYLAYPNDTLQSVSCIYAHDDERYEDDNIYATRTLSVIIWINLFQYGLYSPSLEQLKREVWRILRDLDCINSVTGSVDQTTSGMDSIYPGFDLSGLEERFNTYPFGAFRIECVAKYPDLCF